MHIAVVIPTYNRPEFLKKAIESVLSQTFQNFTIFISDNASEMDTESVVKSFNDTRLCYHRHDVNIGMQANWKFCLENAPGEYIALLEDDNYFLPNHLSEAVECLEKYTIGFYSCNSRIGEHPYTDSFQSLLVREANNIDVVELILDINIPASGVVFLKSLISFISFEKAADLWCMDRFFWRSIIINAGILFNPNENIVYVIHEENMTHGFLINRRARAKASAQNRYVDRYTISQYLKLNPDKGTEMVKQFCTKDFNKLAHILPCFFTNKNNLYTTKYGNHILDIFHRDGGYFFYKKMPIWVSKILIKNVNNINQFIGSWVPPAM